MPHPPASATDRARATFARHGGSMRMTDALRAGISRTVLYGMVDAGHLERVSRGLYRLADADPPSHPDLVTVAARAPGGVICLISALSFHNLTTQIPHQVDLAIPRGAEAPRIDHPPVQHYWWSDPAFTEGVEEHHLDGTTVRIYSAAKTIADVFKYRNKLGLDVALEAMDRYLKSDHVDLESLMHFAQVNRVHNVIRPYLEAKT